MTAHRIHAIDLARSVALLAMAGYHFTFDLMLFGHLPPGFVFQGPWPLIARGIASSFLFLAGVSLWLAHARGIRWPAFWMRFAMVAGAALLVTTATYFGMGASFIRWGILHAIAAGSLIGLAFLRAPILLTLAVAALVFAAPHLARFELFNAPHWLWLGLSTEIPPMMDYEPLLPWLCPVLLGIVFARLMARSGGWDWLRLWQPGRLARAALWPGRHSLAIYLVHQPVLFGGLYLFTRYL
ncbi:DUF1624 domain-containing protein [Pseudorhodobacter sp. MZDSW-24AT]|uniref:DUF1624 domain-containing protein n=1 Tax=Pseudorhodobacter sp. MZDSW-24AT TaxID=2052957 RepID=UPI000C1F634A|nr:heparan-alpha-glucosaminide N-acetyltransferase [Pseudorhodobacter sp. MZDSW-24AT]PJF09696.1 hypothetical protein CUR21_07300 [Pseudorhodobacter sp. MZDSW-24AT]